MSDGGKKPGLRDIGDLKARLGMLNKGPAAPPPAPSPGANPFAPRTSAPPPSASPVVDIYDDPDVEIGGDTAIVRIGSDGSLAAAMSTPAQAPAARSIPPASFSAPPEPQPVPRAAVPLSKPSPAPAPAPAPAPSMGGGGLFGDDLFAPSEPVAPAPSAAPVAAAPTAASAANAADAAAAAAAFFAASAPPPPPAGPSSQELGFANPLQRGAFKEAAAPVDLSADEEAALKSFEGKQAGIRPSLAIGMTVGVALITTFFGFFIGDARKERQLLNAQIDASVQVRDRMNPALSTLTEVSPIIMAMAANPTQVEWSKVAAIPAQMPQVEVGNILATPVPLQRDLASAVGRSAGDLQMLFLMLDEHRRLTLGRDKNELEAMAKGDTFGQHAQYAVFSQPRSPTDPALAKGLPPEGRIVALVGRAEQGEDEVFVIPALRRGDKEPKPVAVDGIVLIPKTDLLTEAGSGNVQTLYTKRVEALRDLLKRIQGARPVLEEQLKTQAARSKVFSL